MAGVAANAPSPEGWQQAKPLIEQLYVQQDRPLKDVRAYLAEHRNFLATERMFKQRLKEWGFDRKKVKAAEWRYMLRMTRQRRNGGKDSAFRVNGKVIVWSNIRKHLKRKKKTEDEFLSAGPEAEVEDVICYTPPGSPNLSISQSASSQISPLPHRSTYSSSTSTQTHTEQRRSPISSKHSFSPEPDLSSLRSAIVANSRSPSISSGPSSIPDPEFQSLALRPIAIRSLATPLDEAAALRISRLMCGSFRQYKSPVQPENLLSGLAITCKRDQTDSTSESRTIMLPGDNTSSSSSSSNNNNNDDGKDARLDLSTGRKLSEEETASRWVVYYFQACIRESQGDLRGMKENVKQASEVFQTMLLVLNPYLLTGMTLMTSILYFHGYRALLEEFLSDACQVIEKKLSRDHPIYIPYRYMLIAIRMQPETDEMSRALEHAYEAFRLTWGEVHPNTLTALYYYGCSLVGCRRFDEAELQLQKCLELSEKNLGGSHFLTVWTLATIARSLCSSDQGKEIESIKFQEDAIHRCSHLMHGEHPYLLELKRNLANIHRKLGNLHEVESLYRVVMNGRIKMLGLNAEITQASVNDLYNVLQAQNKLQEAAHLRADIAAMKASGEGQSACGITC